MESLTSFDIALIVGCSLGAATLIALISAALGNRHRKAKGVVSANLAPTFLFDGENLRDATLDAQLLIKDAAKHLSDRQAMLHVFAARFPTLDQVMNSIERGATQRVPPADAGKMSMRVAEIDGLIRVTLLGTDTDESESISQVAAHDALVSEVHFLRSLADQSPQLIWQQDHVGKLSWANTAYMALSDKVTGNTLASTWPSEAVFPDLHLDADSAGPKNRRASVTFPNEGTEAWYDVTTVKAGKSALHFANEAGAIVQAEQSKRKAVQTFSKIFAHLSIGLAIFDQKRRLSIFNPALTALTRISPQNLTARPTIDMFLDELREARMLPEPKNYITWREQFKELEDAARAGTYCEMWDLPDGQTFRVTGQPYQDNAFAFFFEDVTAEIALTRRFRTDIETGQSVLDTLDDAIAVFSESGTLVMSNEAYTTLWNVEADNLFQHRDFTSEMSRWQDQTAGSPVLSKLQSFFGSGRKEQTWKNNLSLDDGRQYDCTAKLINGGKTMVSFAPTTAKIRPIIHKISMPDPAIHSQMKG